MPKYDELLKEAKDKAKAFALTAREYIPKMYDALRNEDSDLTPQEDLLKQDAKADKLGSLHLYIAAEILLAGNLYVQSAMIRSTTCCNRESKAYIIF